VGVIGAVLLAAGASAYWLINRKFDRIRDDNPFFDAFEEYLFYPHLFFPMLAARPVALIGAVLLLVGLF
jgi:hypothetical protein